MTKQEFQKLTENLLFLDGATGSNLMAQGMPRGILSLIHILFLEMRKIFRDFRKMSGQAG